VLNYLLKVVTLAFTRLPAGSPARGELLDRALEHLSDVTYHRLRDMGFEPNGIIDIGAHVGDWTRSIKAVFPEVPVLMVEARESQRPHLEKACDELDDVSFVISLLGSEPKETVEFHVLDTGSSMFSERSNVPRSSERLAMHTLDEIAGAAARLASPLFLKLDVQGAELEILKGAADTLTMAEVVQLEVQLLHYNEGAPQAADVVAFMDRNGFALFDVAGFVRPNGTDLVQLDLIFARKDSSLRRDYFKYPVQASQPAGEQG
jgi:FkbM family methyltransferase